MRLYSIIAKNKVYVRVNGDNSCTNHIHGMLLEHFTKHAAISASVLVLLQQEVKKRCFP